MNKFPQRRRSVDDETIALGIFVVFVGFWLAWVGFLVWCLYQLVTWLTSK